MIGYSEVWDLLEMRYRSIHDEVESTIWVRDLRLPFFLFRLMVNFYRGIDLPVYFQNKIWLTRLTETNYEVNKLYILRRLLFVSSRFPTEHLHSIFEPTFVKLSYSFGYETRPFKWSQSNLYVKTKTKILINDNDYEKQ